MSIVGSHLRRVRVATYAVVISTGLVFPGGASAQGAPSPVPRADSVVVFENVSVLPMDRERVVEGQTVIVRDGRVAYVGGAAAAPRLSGARRIDGRGKFLMPGLAEMHAHIPGTQAPPDVPRRVLELFALNGVTTIRGMLGDPLHLAMRDGVERGEWFGPHVIAGSPSLNGQSVATPAQAASAVAAHKRAGYDLLKIHPGIRREAFDTLAATADRLGIRFAGHVPFDVGVRRAIAARYASIEHLDGYIEAMVPASRAITQEQAGFFGAGVAELADPTLLPALVAETKRQQVWMAPTQVLMVNMAGEIPVDSLLALPELRYWYPNQVTQWAKATRDIRAGEGFDSARRARFLELRRQLMRSMRDAGVGFILASDAPQMWNVPGFSIARELASLVDAGLTPFEALRSGTVSVAEYLGRSDFGTVAMGKRGDLILLDRNPLTDVKAVARPSGVLLRGAWLPREELDRRLQALVVAR